MGAESKAKRKRRNSVRWPKGHEGGALFCNRCTKPILLIAKGTTVDIGQQRLAVELHRSRCSRAQ